MKPLTSEPIVAYRVTAGDLLPSWFAIAYFNPLRDTGHEIVCPSYVTLHAKHTGLLLIFADGALEMVVKGPEDRPLTPISAVDMYWTEPLFGTRPVFTHVYAEDDLPLIWLQQQKDDGVTQLQYDYTVYHIEAEPLPEVINQSQLKFLKLLV